MLFTYLLITGYISLLMVIRLLGNHDLKKAPYPGVVILVSLAFCLIWPISLWGWLGMASRGLVDKVNEVDKDEVTDVAVIPETHRLGHCEDVTVEGDRFFIYGDMENHSEAIHFVTLSQLMLKSGMTEKEAEDYLFIEQWARELDKKTFQHLQQYCWVVWDKTTL